MKPKTKINEQTKRNAVSEYREGSSSTVLAKKYGVTKATILAWARKAGVTIRPRGRKRSKKTKPLATATTKAEAIAAILSIAEAHHLRVTVSA